MTPLRKKADIAWSRAIRVLNGYAPDDRTVDAHHIMKCGNKSTRYDIANGFLFSRVDHSYYEDHPEEARLFFIKRLGEKEYNRLKQKSLKIKKWQPHELEEIINQFKSILKGASK